MYQSNTFRGPYSDTLWLVTLSHSSRGGHLGFDVITFSMDRGLAEGKAGCETYIMDGFWHKNRDRIPHITGSFIEDFASANLPIKATQARGYKFFSRNKENNYSLWLVLLLSEDQRRQNLR